MTIKQYIISFAAAALTAVLLTGCSGDSASDISPDPTPTTGKSEIKVNADIWRMMEGTRVATYDSQAALQTEGYFTCAVYQENTATPYINATTVDWNGSTAWEFTDGKHYWPATGNLDFFAYMPATKPDYISSINYAVSGEPAAPHPYFVCANLPMTNAGQSSIKEFIYALTTGQNKADQGASGVTMTFKHPFARVCFKLSAESGTNVTVNSITIPNLYTGGTFTHSSGWASPTGDTDLVISGNPAGNPATGDSYYLVIPNNYGTKTFSVNFTWKEWDEDHNTTFTTPLDINWQAGYSYTYKLTITKDDLKVDIEKFTEQW